MKVIVIGAGMGGMSAALALRQIGINVEVYEQVRENKPVGAAISVWSNGVLCLNHLGLETQTRELGGMVHSMSYRDGMSDEVMCQFSMSPLIEAVGQRPYPIARAELQLMLMQAFGYDEIHFGAQMVSLHSKTDHVKVDFADGTSARADVVICADGAHSRSREYVLGYDIPRRYAGYVNYNGLIPLDPAIGPPTEWTTYVGEAKRASVMPVSGDRFYFFLDIPGPEGHVSRPGTALNDVRSAFGHWGRGVATLLNALENTVINRVEIFDREPCETWVKDRVALLGDAAHCTTPDIGQGGCSAMEDAIALQFAFLHHPHDVYAALRGYEQARISRARDLVLRARKRCDITHGKNPQVTDEWYEQLRQEDGTHVLQGIINNIKGGPLT